MKTTNTILFLILIVISVHGYINYNSFENRASRWVKQNCNGTKAAGDLHFGGLGKKMSKPKPFKGSNQTKPDMLLCGYFMMSHPEYFLD